MNFSMLAGVAEEASLSLYHPEAGKAGIERPYVHLADCRVRLANIYVGRPRTLLHQEFLQTGFDHRKAEKWKNVLGLAWHFLGQSGGWQAAWITLRLQATLLAHEAGQDLPETASRQSDDADRACLQHRAGRTGAHGNHALWRLSLDADNEEDFEILSTRFADWSLIGPA